MSQYFENDKNIKSETIFIKYYINGKELLFESDNGVFCKNYIDFGSSLLIKNCLKENLGIDGIDLGCGIGVVGISISSFFVDKNFTYIDVNDRALDLTKKNLERHKLKGKVINNNGLENIMENSADFIITNPPIRAGKSVIYKFYEDSYKVLKNNGKLYIVIQKKQGAESSKNKLIEIFKNVDILDKEKGYFIFRCEKRI